jgi:hypothetical protein
VRAIASLLLALILSLTSAGPAAAQSSASDDQQRLLELKAAWVRMEHARSTRDRARALWEERLVAEADHLAAQSAYQVAQVDYQQRFLQLFAATPRISVERCAKSYEGDARQHVTVVLRNSSAPTLDYRSVGIVDDQVPMPDVDRLREVTGVSVSLTDDAGTVISSPYELAIATIAPGQTAALRFQLLKDVDVVRVLLRYAGRVEALPLYLEKDASADVVRMQSRQFSQECDLGASAIYDLRLERYGVAETVFALRVLALPEEVGAEFVDAGSGARLSQIKFTEGASSQQLQLRVFLPDVVGERVAIDQPLEFWVAALDRAQADALPAGRGLPATGIEPIRASAARLELLPRGIGRLEVTAPSLFREVRRDEPAELTVTVRNIGTRRIDNVRLHADTPAGWRTTVEPALVDRLETGRDAVIQVRLEPPAGVAVGDYPVRLRTEAYSDNRRIDSSDQTARIQVATASDLLLTGALALLLVGVVGGVVLWGIRATRR